MTTDMSGSAPVKHTAIASAALTGYPFCFVKYNGTNNTVAPIAADTDIPCGVVQNAADVLAAGDPVELVVVGMTKIELNATLTSGALIQTGAVASHLGQAIAAKSTGYVAGHIVDGGADDEIGSAMVNCINPWLKA